MQAQVSLLGMFRILGLRTTVSTAEDKQIQTPPKAPKPLNSKPKPHISSPWTPNTEPDALSSSPLRADDLFRSETACILGICKAAESSLRVDLRRTIYYYYYYDYIHVYMYTYIYIYTRIYMYVYVYIHICIRAYVYVVCICMCIPCAYACRCMYKYTHFLIEIYIYMHIRRITGIDRYRCKYTYE